MALQTVSLSGLPQLLHNLNDITLNQMPFALASALTATARDVQVAETAGLETSFDRPTPFTMKAFGYQPATKTELVATVFAKDAQNKYLSVQAEGGVRGLKTFEEIFSKAGRPMVTLPGKTARLDQYGNLTRAQIKRIAQNLNSSGKAKRFFKGVPKGSNLPPGIYARVNDNTKITPLLVFATSAQYQQRFQFSAIASTTVTEQFEQNMIAAWERALATAR